MILKKIKNKFLVPCIVIGAVSMNLGFTNTVKAKQTDPCIEHVVIGEHTKQKPLKVSCDKKSYLYAKGVDIYLYNNFYKTTEKVNYQDNRYIVVNDENVNLHITTGITAKEKKETDSAIVKSIEDSDDREQFKKNYKKYGKANAEELKQQIVRTKIVITVTN